MASSLTRAAVPPPPPPRSAAVAADLATGTATPTESCASSISSTGIQKRSPGAASRSSQGYRVPPPPPPRRQVPPPPPPPPRRAATANTTATTPTHSLPPKRQRPIPPPPPPLPPPPPPKMSLDSSEELASKARDMFHKCLHRAIPTGNMYSGGLGTYYLLLEQSRYQMMLLERQQQQQMLLREGMNNQSSAAGNSRAGGIRHKPSNQNTPIRCKRLLKQALEGAQTATNRFKRGNSSNLSHQRSNISLLGGEWVGSHALLAVCYRRLEDFTKRQEEQQEPAADAGGDDRGGKAPSLGRDKRDDEASGDQESTLSSKGGTFGERASSSKGPSRSGTTHGSSLFASSRRGGTRKAKSSTLSSSASVVSGVSNASTLATFATLNPRPRSERVVDKILNRLEKQHFALDEDDDNLTYYTYGSNYTNNTTNTNNTNYTNYTMNTLTIAPVWNQDVLGGRAGGLQAIWWLRKEFGDVTLGRDLVVLMAIKILEEGFSTAASMGFHDRRSPSHPNSNHNTDDAHKHRTQGISQDQRFHTAEDSDDDDGSYDGSEILFWVCDSQGAHKAYLGAARGVVGILHTLLGLSHGDWELVEEQIPNARRHVRNTIGVFVSPKTAKSSSNENSGEANEAENLPLEEPSSPEQRGQQDGELAEIRQRILNNSFHESPLPPSDGFLFDHSLAANKKTADNTSPKITSGNLRPRLNAPPESDTTVDWFHGATGLAMLFLEAAKVFRCKEYLQEAHRLCDTVIFPRGLAEQQKKSKNPIRNGRSGGTSNAGNRQGPVGLAGMAVCFLQLSQFCSNHDFDDSGGTEKAETRERQLNAILTKAGLPPKTSLKKAWKIRAALYAQHAHQEWTNYLKSIPTATGTYNAYSLYEGMGGLISLLWQLSLSTFSASEEISMNGIQDNHCMGIQLPLYGLGFVDDDSDKNTDESWNSMMLSFGDVMLSETPPNLLRAPAGWASSQQALADSRRRRAAADAEARKRRAMAEEAKKEKEELAKAERAVQLAQRRVERESRRKAQLLARKKALEVARQKEEEASKRKSQDEANKEAEDKSKRQALLLARKQAKERVEARRKEKEIEELAKAQAEARRKAIEAENKRKSAEEETKKRRALAEARLRRQQKEAEKANQREEARKQKEEADRLRRAEELKQKEEERKKRAVELRQRQLRAARIAKEKELQKALQDEADRERRKMELKEEERKREDADRRRRLEIYKERRRKEDQALAAKKAKENEERKLAVRKSIEAKEKRRLQLQQERIQKQKDAEEERLRKELQRALDKEVEKQRQEEKARLKAGKELKLQEALNAINEIDVPPPPPAPPSSHNYVYSPSFAEKKPLTPSHYSVPTKSSLFWSLQSDSNIGNSDSYKPALVATDPPPNDPTPGGQTKNIESEVPASSQ